MSWTIEIFPPDDGGVPGAPARPEVRSPALGTVAALVCGALAAAAALTVVDHVSAGGSGSTEAVVSHGPPAGTAPAAPRIGRGDFTTATPAGGR